MRRYPYRYRRSGSNWLVTRDKCYGYFSELLRAMPDSLVVSRQAKVHYLQAEAEERPPLVMN
jgi:hypothetical protein